MATTNSLDRIVKGALRRVYPPGNMWFFGHRLIHHPRARDLFARPFAATRPSIKLTEVEYEATLKTLEEEGWVKIPDLFNTRQIADIHAWLAGKPVFDKWHPELGEFLPESPPASSHTGTYKAETVLACPHLIEAANDPLILAVAAKFLGCSPTLSHIGAYWSFPGPDAPFQEQFFHRDLDDIKFVKLFVYLTDISAEDGPHVFVARSHRSGALGQIRRYQDAEVEAVFGREPITSITGKAGTSFLENTFGFHKGELPRRGRRLLFGTEYSILRIPANSYHPQAMSRALATPIDPYVNRLYVRADA